MAKSLAHFLKSINYNIKKVKLHYYKVSENGFDGIAVFFIMSFGNSKDEDSFESIKNLFEIAG